MIDDGVIKFNCEWDDSPVEMFAAFADLKSWRDRLFQMNLIGETAGIGYGNISVRGAGRSFMITATQTGRFPEIGLEHCAHVLDYDFKANRIVCRGRGRASSESLTHAMFYELSPAVGGVIHVHSRVLWRALQGCVPTTGKDVPYGTREMSLEVRRLFNEGGLERERILVMAGHEDGVITFGRDLDDAGKTLMKYVMETGAAGV